VQPACDCLNGCKLAATGVTPQKGLPRREVTVSLTAAANWPDELTVSVTLNTAWHARDHQATVAVSSLSGISAFSGTPEAMTKKIRARAVPTCCVVVGCSNWRVTPDDIKADVCATSGIVIEKEIGAGATKSISPGKASAASVASPANGALLAAAASLAALLVCWLA